MNWVKKIATLWRSPELAKKGGKRRLKLAKRKLLMQLPNVVHAGNRAHCKGVEKDGERYIKKVFANDDVAKACMEREIAAREIFEDCPWVVPIVESGESHITFPLLPEEHRLDKLADRLTAAEKLEIAGQSLQVAFEIFLAGYAHRDFHSKNMFWLDGQLRVVDFEVLQPYAPADAPPFLESYDITGEGLVSPFETMRMCYGSSDPASLVNVLQVPLQDAIGELEAVIKDELKNATLTFAKRGKRHVCRAQRIYNSIDLPYLKVNPSEAQRNCAARFKTLGITQEDVKGKRLLDLGSNIGGMIFESLKLEPAECTGVEYDSDKVDVSRMLAAYNGIHNAQFVQADIDDLEASELGEPFGVVFCFAINEHVNKKDRLFGLLSQVAAQKLYFEGNAGTDVEAVTAKLLAAGFNDVQSLGMSDDDYMPENHNRPLLVATK